MNGADREEGGDGRALGPGLLVGQEQELAARGDRLLGLFCEASTRRLETFCLVERRVERREGKLRQR